MTISISRSYARCSTIILSGISQIFLFQMKQFPQNAPGTSVLPSGALANHVNARTGGGEEKNGGSVM